MTRNPELEMRWLQTDWVSPPGETIEATLKLRRRTVEAFAFIMGLTLAETDDLLKGRLAITADMAQRLSDNVGASKAFWMCREQHYREDLARLGITP